MAGRPRTPTDKLKLAGTFRDDRHGSRVDDPEILLGPPPKGMDKTARALWLKIKKEALWIKGVDASFVEVYVTNFANWRKTQKVVDEIASTSLVGTDAHAQVARTAKIHYDQFTAAAARLGLSPTDRAKVEKVEPPKEKSKKGRFFG
jgi:phage terminase small subunit